MTRDETRELLATIASFDTRKTYTGTDVQAWHLALHDEPALADCQAAIVSHYRDETRMVMPADVRRRTHTIRDDRRGRTVVKQLTGPDCKPMPDGWREKVLAQLPARRRRRELTFAEGMRDLTQRLEDPDQGLGSPS